MDAYFELGPAPWDVCAGFVIAREAGGVVHVGTAPDGRDVTVVAAPGIAAALLDLLTDAGAFG